MLAIDHSTQADGLNDSVHISAFDMPMSAFLSLASRRALDKERNKLMAIMAGCPSQADAIDAYRDYMEEHYYRDIIAELRLRYKVNIAAEVMGGVATEIIAPADGVHPCYQDSVLINLHAGGFTTGGRWGGQVESIPIASLTGINVVSIDYRKAPEHHYPAATEDVVTVYRELLKQYQPENIGLYGCSAGGVLAGQAIARLDKLDLPLPAAVGMFCGAPLPITGDANHWVAAINGEPPAGLGDFSYFDGVSDSDVDAFPGLDDRLLKRFPPSLLMSASRDFVFSQIITMHNSLVRQGVPADLHLWDGLGHTFLYNPELPETDEAFNVIAAFFRERLK